MSYIDLSSKRTLEDFEKETLAIKKVNVDLPSWAIASLDKEAKRMGVTRQSIIKMWLIQKLDDLSLSRKSFKTSGIILSHLLFVIDFFSFDNNRSNYLVMPCLIFFVYGYPYKT